MTPPFILTPEAEQRLQPRLNGLFRRLPATLFALALATLFAADAYPQQRKPILTLALILGAWLILWGGAMLFVATVSEWNKRKGRP